MNRFSTANFLKFFGQLIESTCDLPTQAPQLSAMFHPSVTACRCTPRRGRLGSQQKILYTIFEYFSHPYISRHILLPIDDEFL